MGHLWQTHPPKLRAAAVWRTAMMKVSGPFLAARGGRRDRRSQPVAGAPRAGQLTWAGNWIDHRPPARCASPPPPAPAARLALSVEGRLPSTGQTSSPPRRSCGGCSVSTSTPERFLRGGPVVTTACCGRIQTRLFGRPARFARRRHTASAGGSSPLASAGRARKRPRGAARARPARAATRRGHWLPPGSPPYLNRARSPARMRPRARHIRASDRRGRLCGRLGPASAA